MLAALAGRIVDDAPQQNAFPLGRMPISLPQKREHRISLDGTWFCWNGRAWVNERTATAASLHEAKRAQDAYVKTLPSAVQVAGELERLLEGAPLDAEGVACLKALLWEPREYARSDLKLGYHLSPYWRSFRQVFMRKVGPMCEACGEQGAKEIHHFSYERYGAETARDVASLCRRCHRLAHKSGSFVQVRVELSRDRKGLAAWPGPSAAEVREGAAQHRRMYPS